MAKNETRRIPPSALMEDLDIYSALKAITGYTPSNPAYTLVAVDAIRARLVAKQEAEAQAAAAQESARDDLVAAQWDFHNAMLGAKDQVVAQVRPELERGECLEAEEKDRVQEPNPKGFREELIDHCYDNCRRLPTSISNRLICR